MADLRSSLHKKATTKVLGGKYPAKAYSKGSRLAKPKKAVQMFSRTLWGQQLSGRPTK